MTCLYRLNGVSELKKTLSNIGEEIKKLKFSHIYCENMQWTLTCHLNISDNKHLPLSNGYFIFKYLHKRNRNSCSHENLYIKHLRDFFY